MRRALLSSVAFHVVLVLTGVVSWSNKAHVLPPPEVITVDLVAAAPTPVPEPVKAAPDPAAAAPLPKREAAAPDPAPRPEPPKPPEPAPKPPEPAPKPKVEPKPEPPPTPATRPKVEAPKEVVEKPPEPKKTTEPVKKPEPEKKPEVAKKPEPAKKEPDKVEPKPPEDSFAALLKSVEKLERRVQADVASPGKGRAEPLKQPAQGTQGPAQLSSGEIDAIRRQIESCWNVPVGIRGVENMQVKLRINMNRDGSVGQVAIEDQSRLGTDPIYRTVAESAQRAVLSCSLRLPAEKYEQWREMVMTFYPKEALNG